MLNTMRFAQWVFEGNHESIVGQAQFFGSIGSDDFGQLLIRQTISDRVEPLFVPVSNPSNASARCKPVLETQDSGFHDIDDTVDDDEKQSKNDITTDNTDSITGKNSNSTPDPTKSDTYHNQDWQTGVCVALNTHNGANRSMIAFLGAARALASNHVQDHLEHIRQANAIYTSGFLLGSSAEAVWKLVELRCPGQLIAFNLSATYVCHAFGDLLWRLLPHLDIVFCNSEELKAFAEFNKWKVSSK